MSTKAMNIVAVTTSLSEDSTTLKLTDRILASAASAGESVSIDVSAEVINIRNHATALTDMTLTGFRSEELEAAFATIAAADAIVTVAPVYKAAPVGLHTLFWQLMDDKALSRKPVLIASTGGTARHSLAGDAVLRPMLAYLKGIVVPTTVFAATDDWGSVEGGRALNARIRQAAEELVSLTASLTGLGVDDLAEADDPESAPARSVFGAVSGERGGDEFDPERITPFAQLLEG